MTMSRTLRLVAFVGCAYAFVLRKDTQVQSILNASEAAILDVDTESLRTLTMSSEGHGENGASSWATTTIDSDSSVRLEPTYAVPDVTPTQTVTSPVSKQPNEPPDIGSAIEVLQPGWTTITLTAMPTIHWESSAPAWVDSSKWIVSVKSSATDYGVSSSAAAHWESSADGWADDGDQASKTRYVPITVTENSWTKNVKTSQATGPRSPVDGPPQVTTVPTRIITDYPPPPPVTFNGITVGPTAVTRRSTVTGPDGSLTTTDKVEFMVAVESSTLGIDAPITVNNVVVSLTTNTAGSTVLYAGDLTTTLPAPTAGEVRTVAGLGRINIVTSIIDGTTKYLLAGQTLAPGQPVTIGNVPISVDFDGDKTVLVVGEKTTTMAASDSDIQTITDWASISVGTEGTVANTDSASARPTSTQTGSSQPRDPAVPFAVCAVGLAMLIVGP